MDCGAKGPYIRSFCVSGFIKLGTLIWPGSTIGRAWIQRCKAKITQDNGRVRVIAPAFTEEDILRFDVAVNDRPPIKRCAKWVLVVKTFMKMCQDVRELEEDAPNEALRLPFIFVRQARYQVPTRIEVIDGYERTPCDGIFDQLDGSLMLAQDILQNTSFKWLSACLYYRKGVRDLSDELPSIATSFHEVALALPAFT
ncbi:hypothetical protein JMJ35_005140 [Cladonia borealis]|uniref:Uncharacterized protein n=1 Tax=Cladonia borealis TaxID=184061 RepID=A0AA39QZA2_9LECA|nr:hypothetical protein JMJ35_005140 [Cladonia borealis]